MHFACSQRSSGCIDNRNRPRGARQGRAYPGGHAPRRQVHERAHGQQRADNRLRHQQHGPRRQDAQLLAVRVRHVRLPPPAGPQPASAEIRFPKPRVYFLPSFSPAAGSTASVVRRARAVVRESALNKSRERGFARDAPRERRSLRPPAATTRAAATALAACTASAAGAPAPAPRTTRCRPPATRPEAAPAHPVAWAEQIVRQCSLAVSRKVGGAKTRRSLQGALGSAGASALLGVPGSAWRSLFVARQLQLLLERITSERRRERLSCVGWSRVVVCTVKPGGWSESASVSARGNSRLPMTW